MELKYYVLKHYVLPSTASTSSKFKFGGCKKPPFFLFLREQRMPQLGSNEKPMMISSKKRGKTLGLAGSFFEKDRKKKYDENYDKIFKKKDK
jgi:hypothetical protein